MTTSPARSDRAPAVTLLLLALFAGITWRAELEWRSGWASLAWIGYFHWAIPVFVGLFIAWTVWVTRVRRRATFVFTLVGFAVCGYALVSFSVHTMFGRFGGLVSLWITLPIWPLIPLLFCLLCQQFGAPISLSRAIVTTALFLVSWPVAIFVRGFFEQRGSPDLIHAVKSGFVIPFLVLSLGFPLLRFRTRSS